MKIHMSIANLVTKAARVVVRRYQKEVGPLGISPSQAGIVFILGKIGPSTQVEIAGYLHLEKTNVNAMIKKLEAAGWVSVENDPQDARKKRNILTAAGRSLASELGKVDRRVADELLELTGDPEEAAVIRNFLERIVFGEKS